MSHGSYLSIISIVLGNPIEEVYSKEGTWRERIADTLSELKILDGK